MLSVDAAKLESWRREERKQALRQRRQQLLAQELENHQVTVTDDEGRDVSSLSAQLGKPLTAEQFMAKLKKCNKSLYFIRHPQYPLYGIYLINPKGRKWVSPEGHTYFLTHLMGMPSDLMPEFTVIKKKQTRVANKDVLDGGYMKGNSEVAKAMTERVLKLSDSPTQETVETAYKQLIAEGVINPQEGWDTVETVQEIDRLGWRSVVVRLLHQKLLTEYDVIQHFGWTPSRTSKRWRDRTEGPK